MIAASCGSQANPSPVVTPIEGSVSAPMPSSLADRLRLLSREARLGDVVEVAGNAWSEAGEVEIFLLTEQQYNIDLERASRALEALREGEFVKLGSVQPEEGNLAFSFPLQASFVSQAGDEIEISAGDRLFVLGYQRSGMGSTFMTTHALLVVQ